MIHSGMFPKKPRILMFAPFCYPPASAEAIVTSKLLLVFLDARWEIDVITQTGVGQSYPHDPEGIWKSLNRIVTPIDVGAGLQFLESVPGSAFKKTLSKARSLMWVAKAVLSARRLSAKKGYDFILSRVSPQYGHMPALVVSGELKIPWVANWSDPMPPRKSPPPYGEGPSAKTPSILRKYMEAVARNAAWHTFPSERLRKYICYYLPQCMNKSSVMPHPALAVLRGSVAQNTKEFSLCHVGALGLRKPDTFLEGVSRFVRKSGTDVPFSVRFVGGESKRARELVTKLGLEDKVIIEEARNYEETQKAAENSTVLVVIEAQCEEGIFFPSKFVDFVQTGRPILAVSPAKGTLHDIISKHGGGIAVDVLSANAVESAIERFFAAWKAGTLSEEYGSAKLFQLFSEEQIISQYAEIFSRINKESCPAVKGE